MWRRGVSAVSLIQINRVGLKPGETSLDGFQNMRTAQTRAVGQSHMLA